MRQARTLRRRGFVKLCASAATALGANPRVLADPKRPLKRYQRVRLVNARNEPITTSGLVTGQSYIFNYPYVSTPCFLLDLGRPVTYDEELMTEQSLPYVWPGGVGPNRSLVAFSAICAHKMSHPARSVSFINYRHHEVSFRTRDEQIERRKQVIVCCSENSVYDPAEGARVLGGPARQPLTAILIEHDRSNDSLVALGTYGGEMYERFFEQFSFRLSVELGIADVRRQVAGTAPVVTIADYSHEQMMC